MTTDDDDVVLRTISNEIDELTERIQFILEHPQEAGNIDGIGQNLAFLTANFLNDVHRIANALETIAKAQGSALNTAELNEAGFLKKLT